MSLRQESFWQRRADGVVVSVKVQPRARRPGVLGARPSASGERLRIAVTEAAEDGKANRAACALLAKALDCPPSSVRVLAGAAAREKSLSVSGDSAMLAEKLRSL